MIYLWKPSAKSVHHVIAGIVFTCCLLALITYCGIEVVSLSFTGLNIHQGTPFRVFFSADQSFLCAHIVNIWNGLPNSVVDASTVNAFNAQC